jgi:hypothetical protein
MKYIYLVRAISKDAKHLARTRMAKSAWIDWLYVCLELCLEKFRWIFKPKKRD